MILEAQRKTFFYHCLAITGLFCIIAFFKYLLSTAIQVEFAKEMFIAVVLQVAVVATVGLAIALLLMVVEFIFPIEVPSYKFQDTKVAKQICSIGIWAECIFLMPVLIAIIF